MQALSLQQIRTGKGWPRGARFLMLAPASTAKGPTPRQRAVVQALCDGLTLREAAEALHISRETARTHAEAFRRRVHARSIGHGIAIGFREGWLT